MPMVSAMQAGFLDSNLGRQVQCTGAPAGLQDRRPGADAAADRHHRVEAEFIEAEIQRPRQVRDVDKVTRQGRYQ